MCYALYMSTDCPDDLSRQSTERIRFSRPSSSCPSILKHEHKWYIGSKSGCSCTFRHLCHESVELGFRAPEDWYPEDRDGIDATRELYKILKDIVTRGGRVEVLDCWSGDEENKAELLEVSLEQVSADRFRLFEGYLFTLTSG
ncbi:hypothetical protein [Pontiella sp.]|uniref:hypothetical protein n=1 Tax=Pontiella sp. TaxID=2837462 RepID=UPI00356951EB